ncbi:DUF2637 domain-containing protein [Plantactinospora sp. KLBMP9567]|uniref:DUF2637 domain-containing protein n=1 Tax=Plantactinospora sp. KLBMP9567 TaxID=3085900 RepID=UPI002981803D|nr:DUF2637 domain-containing protein [Plantactinospora sp. KLBMP9567]MDW5330805.1 DUF2637 domain-containing protein [Plantactinospora sp. KLBMP9567]
MTDKTWVERVEGAVLVLILLTVGGLAGAASFTHVHDWTMANSPAGTGDWFGWANAAISELIPLAALLTIRRRRRTGGPIGYPMFLLVAAVALSLSAQLAVAKPGLSGWLLSAVPALAFLGLSKLVLSTKPASPAGSASETTEQDHRPDQDETEGGPDASVEEQQGDDQAPTGDLIPLARRHPAEHRPALVPVPATAFPTRNGTPPQIPAEVTR